MMGQGHQDKVLNAGRAPRCAPRRDALLRLVDGRRTAAEIAQALGVSQKNVRALAHHAGVAHLLRPACGAPIAARLPADLVLRDLALPREIAVWLIDQTKEGAALQDVLRGIVIDAFQEETGL
ncbi:hypothetical protein [Pseudotabrizicola algicola]|uniref:Uncharacterized protein n=1 Tax=Pseudotabrizicola algicola TaxID=2709381 RepID=A0A6B3RQ06_9RHOB|nr:hypothetical protein [Pseudotabrizicola algicola]NEX45199.1 hypothetical protein [Pseudotabrizicola algicola]